MVRYSNFKIRSCDSFYTNNVLHIIKTHYAEKTAPLAVDRRPFDGGV